jgi:hypothetical protein
MTLTKFNDHKTEYGIVGKGYKTSVHTPYIFKSGEVITQGESVTVWFSEKYTDNMFIQVGLTQLFPVKIVSGKRHLKGFKSAPSEETLEKWENQSFCKTILGNKTEPDGRDEFGAPSFLLYLGLI